MVVDAGRVRVLAFRRGRLSELVHEGHGRGLCDKGVSELGSVLGHRPPDAHVFICEIVVCGLCGQAFGCSYMRVKRCSSAEDSRARDAKVGGALPTREPYWDSRAHRYDAPYT